MSLTYLSKVTGLSIASIYRKMLELLSMGFVEKVNKGQYVVTARGALLLSVAYLTGAIKINEVAFKYAIMKLKEDWELEDFSDDEVKEYISLLIKGLIRLGRKIEDFCASNLSRTALVLLPDNLRIGTKSLDQVIAETLNVPLELVRKAERVIAKALLELLPVVTLNDGCKAALLIEESAGKPVVRPVAIKCRINGYALRLNCPVLTSIMNKGNLLKIFHLYENK
ncbi:hypothetical protein [Vulcanisaeta souniana]|uniref:Uncharacterized protein n=1 Tax=Vulcanisaeta souniana JCM 11219 TaxID=1293586 RepID=A0A830E6D8_9CREN|nr:hypothetical protein [Vulcanisaeta souniana]GGI87152.1 hypothetical protein GCM10007112_25060 [Vulcanisaeta souniana JCM 11219]